MKRLRKTIALFLVLSIMQSIHLVPYNVFATEVERNNNSETNILILASYHKGYKWSDDVILGITNTMIKDKSNPNVIVEYMDTKRYDSEEYIEQLVETYKIKFKGKEFKEVFAVDDKAFQFLLKHSEELFPGIPVIFTGVNNFDKSMLKGHETITGVTENPSIKETIEGAMKLLPNAKYIYIPLDNTYDSQLFKSQTEEVLKEFQGKINYKFIQINSLDEGIEKINALEEEGFVLLWTLFFNQHNVDTNLINGVPNFSEKISYPIFSPYGDYINRGIVGGKLLYGFFHGAQAAKVGINILNGKNPSEIPVMRGVSLQNTYDYDILKRFNFKESDLPEKSKIVNKNKTHYITNDDIYKYSTALIIVLLLIITYLLINIIKRKKYEKELEMSEYRIRKIIDTSPELIALVDEDNKFIEINKGIKDYFNLKVEDGKEKTIEEISKEHSSLKYFCYEEDITDTKYFQLEFDSGRYFDVIKVPITNDPIGKKAMVIVAHDISEIKRSEQLEKNMEQNNRLMEQIKAFDQLRSEFFANVSHDLRTPINVIMSALQYIDYMERQNILMENEEKLIKYKDIIKQNSFRLMRLINNLIDMTKIDSGFLDLNLKNYNIVSVVEEITLSVVSYVESRGIELVFDTEIEEKFMGCDPDKIERIMLNLLSNAVKFTEKGGSISVNIYDKEDKILISVKDTGVGIPKEKHNSIFKRFVQANKFLSREKDGSGIGLSLVKSLVELHKGEIRLNSEYTEGSEFIIELPVELVDNNDNDNKLEKHETSVEKINIEFSDIYSA